MKRLPTAQQVAAIILAAARECGENPMDIVDRRPSSRARIYAYVALRERAINLTIKEAAALCFAPNADGLKASAIQATRRDWWDLAVLVRVSRAWPAAPVAAPQPEIEIKRASGATVKAETIANPRAAPNHAVSRPVQPPAPPRAPRPVPTPVSRRPAADSRVEIIRGGKPAPAMNLNPLVRRVPPARSAADITAELMGDPPEERSALAEWRRREALKAERSI